ncbi:MAG TPA: hypothetical protein VH349_10895 [Ktedonobacterales bacterium]|jgi:hypothetical protein
MRLALLILSLLTLTVIAIANIGDALIYARNITFNPDGLPAAPSTLATIATIMSGVGGVLSMPLTLATFVLGLILTIQRRQRLWSVAIGAAGALAFIGLLVMAWAILSEKTPVSFCAPFALVPLTTLAYCLVADRRAGGASRRLLRLAGYCAAGVAGGST